MAFREAAEDINMSYDEYMNLSFAQDYQQAEVGEFGLLLQDANKSNYDSIQRDIIEQPAVVTTLYPSTGTYSVSLEQSFPFKDEQVEAKPSPNLPFQPFPYHQFYGYIFDGEVVDDLPQKARNGSFTQMKTALTLVDEWYDRLKVDPIVQPQLYAVMSKRAEFVEDHPNFIIDCILDKEDMGVIYAHFFATIRKKDGTEFAAPSLAALANCYQKMRRNYRFKHRLSDDNCSWRSDPSFRNMRHQIELQAQRDSYKPITEVHSNTQELMDIPTFVAMMCFLNLTINQSTSFHDTLYYQTLRFIILFMLFSGNRGLQRS